ncbi:o-succinylbenzoate--CoA ligase [Alicyclobacillus tolerans]|uniref:o-succinylbenzoate--CoA ligase n=1 Tax=Alicyclobacillus tolerans TaxID=90970 RepID=UPI001EFFF1D1|nr:o-succinylbenzoate--CoA ligase [Alicyclobacillus tolerans]MCF8563419.1 o-succinylbenzoate--CoA ligase [Alicyclobacillus tolerans]
METAFAATGTAASRMPDWLQRRAADCGKVLAFEGIVEGEKTEYTYQELYEQALHLASGLEQMGVQAGQRVAVLVRPGALFIRLVHALIQMKAVIVPLNWRLSPEEMAWQVRDADVQVLVADASMRAVAAEVRNAAAYDLLTPELETLFSNRLPTWWERPRQIHLNEVLAIIYTSGTTGHPKGTLLTYGNFFWSAMASALQLELHKGDKWLAPMPLFHVGGLSVLIRSVIYGTTAVIQDKFDSELVNQTLDQGQIALLSVVPTMLARMVEHRRHGYPERLRCILLGGSGAPKPLLESCVQLGIPVAQSYGLTEACSQVATLSPEDGLKKLGSSGRPLFPTEIAIFQGEAIVGADEIGEIGVRGPTVTPGYLNRPEVNRTVFQDGWFRTGDIGYLDEAGYLYVLDRRNDLIVSGGENVYPAEIESVISAHEAVAEVGVAGMDDEVWGQVPVAFVRLKSGQTATVEELMAFVEPRLAKYKVPKQIHFVEPPLPRNASGKLLRRNLRTWLSH